jgi:hemerythrin-like domain-containing protein
MNSERDKLAGARTRRGFLVTSGQVGASLVASGLAGLAAPSPPPAEEEEVSPAEDLMREHGLLNRVLLVYEEFLRRIGAGQEIDPAIVAQSAGIIRNFVESYHEKLEEDHLFPRFEKAQKLVGLVGVLREQHRAGRQMTEGILQLAKLPTLKNPDDRRRLRKLLQEFIRMYRPHEAREDTVLFPAFHEIVTPREYAALGEEFEDKEHELFGQEGFEGMVTKVATIEKRLGIFELAQFTTSA